MTKAEAMKEWEAMKNDRRHPRDWKGRGRQLRLLVKVADEVLAGKRGEEIDEIELGGDVEKNPSMDVVRASRDRLFGGDNAPDQAIQRTLGLPDKATEDFDVGKKGKTQKSRKGSDLADVVPSKLLRPSSKDDHEVNDSKGSKGVPVAVHAKTEEEGDDPPAEPAPKRRGNFSVQRLNQESKWIMAIEGVLRSGKHIIDSTAENMKIVEQRMTERAELVEELESLLEPGTTADTTLTTQSEALLKNLKEVIGSCVGLSKTHSHSKPKPVNLCCGLAALKLYHSELSGGPVFNKLCSGVYVMD